MVIGIARGAGPRGLLDPHRFRRYARRVSQLNSRLHGPADSASAVERRVRVYESPRLREVGTLTQLTRGITGPSDGLGPGCTLAPPSQNPRPGTPGAP